MPPVYLWIQYTVPCLQHGGFPHSEIVGSILICNSPTLIAAYRVLRRQSVPGHPPCALISLIVSAGATGCSVPGMPASNVCRSVVRSIPQALLASPASLSIRSFRFRFVLCFSQSSYSLLLFPVQFSRCVFQFSLSRSLKTIQSSI